MRRLLSPLLLVLATLLSATTLLTSPAFAADTGPEKPAMRPEQLEASLTYQKGKIVLPGGVATLNLPEQFRYLSPTDAERVLSEGWGNPPGPLTLGMIVPANAGVMSSEGWGVMVTYEADGHVSDTDADSIKYDELLADMQKDTLKDNPSRKEQGYAPITLVGWAEPPRYDKLSHKLYWAKELKTDGADSSSLNYSIRVLGRKGVLVLNAIADMGQIATIKREMPAVTAASEFTEGNRYADFDSKTDKMAEYGLAALVAGGVAAKLGLFGKLFALLLVFKKVVLLAIAGAGAGLFKLFRRKASPGAGSNSQGTTSLDAAPAEKVSLSKVNLDK